jgi:hypothetical protein
LATPKGRATAVITSAGKRVGKRAAMMAAAWTVSPAWCASRGFWSVPKTATAIGPSPALMMARTVASMMGRPMVGCGSLGVLRTWSRRRAVSAR